MGKHQGGAAEETFPRVSSLTSEKGRIEQAVQGTPADERIAGQTKNNLPLAAFFEVGIFVVSPVVGESIIAAVFGSELG